MKQLCCIATITFLSAQAYAGIILPNLSRSKSDANLSPIAVGFSDRNSASFVFTQTDTSGEVNGRDYSDGSSKGGTASLFYSNPTFHMELVGNLSSNETNYVPASEDDSDGNDYDIKGTVAMPIAGNISAGVSFSAGHENTNAAGGRTEVNTTVITPGVGFKFQPNMAVGIGMNHTTAKFETKVIGGKVTEYPSLKTNEVFAGFAYGVDQKIGENGFGVEAVVAHSFKDKSDTYAQGAITTLTVNGNYIIDMVDFNFSAAASTGKDYYDRYTRSSQVVALKPEIMISNPFYVTPQMIYAHAKNEAESGIDGTDSLKVWSYGLAVGMRQAQYDVALTYLHGSGDTDPASIEVDSNSIAGRISYYF